MAVIVAYDDIPPERIIRNRGSGADRPSADVYPFIGAPKDRHGPNAFLVRYIPGTNSSAHYHAADQMQIIVEGKGEFGHHQLEPYQVHFSRAYTPYGPLVPDAHEGWAFVNLRTRPDPEGAQRLSVAREKLMQMRDRRPFQVTCKVEFPAGGNGATMADIAGMVNDEGLRGFALTLGAHGRTTAPTPSQGDGQYLVIVKGSLIHDGRTSNALTLVYVRADEAPFRIEAGPTGLEAMILDFPRVGAAQARHADHPNVANKQWKCLLCAFTYDEAEGMPEEGVAPGTPWEAVPESWSCPDCGATKSDFAMIEY